MFEPNSVGMLYRATGFDVHSRPTYSAAVECPFAPVNMEIGAQKTSVRADSSASRGAADEEAVMRGKILVVRYVAIEIGDKFVFEDVNYRVSRKHIRRSVAGIIDHIECDLELIP